jgi:hypothetical protein
MKIKILSFILVYVLVPLVIIPILCSKTGAWYGLFGSLCYYAGLFIARFDQWIFFPAPLLFCGWYWYTYGFSPTDYVSIYVFCMFCGTAIWKLKDLYNRIVYGILPEVDENDEYGQKVRKMEKMLQDYKDKHPGEAIPQDVVERIKSDVFFN